MKQSLSDLKIAIVGERPSLRNGDAVRMILGAGARVLGARPAPIFRTESDLDADLTHIVAIDFLEMTKSWTHASIAKKLNCPVSSVQRSSVHIVTSDWLLDSTRIGAAQPSESYFYFENSRDEVVEVNPLKRARTDSPVRQIVNQSQIQVHPTKIFENPLSNSSNSFSNRSSIWLIDSLPESVQNSEREWTSISDAVLCKFGWNPADQTCLDKVACFDLDDTLITTKSGRTFGVDENDWRLLDHGIPAKLSQLWNSGYYLAIISNQGGLARLKSFAAFKRKIDAVLKSLGVPIDFVCSYRDDIFRKPRPGMWEVLAKRRNIPLLSGDYSYSYIGDAAGRPQDGLRPKDFSDSDLKFSINCGFNFTTPECFFFNSTKRIHTFLPHPNGIILADQTKYELPNLFSASKEIVAILGPPLSGKSSLAKLFELRGYSLLDSTLSLEEATATAESLMETSNGVVVEPLNTRSTLSKWVAVSEALRKPIRAIVIEVRREIIETLNEYIRLSSNKAAKIDDKVAKYYREHSIPVKGEGFTTIEIVKWSPELPTHSKSLKLFSLYLI